jgi:hypothetical protein
MSQFYAFVVDAWAISDPTVQMKFLVKGSSRAVGADEGLMASRFEKQGWHVTGVSCISRNFDMYLMHPVAPNADRVVANERRRAARTTNRAVKTMLGIPGPHDRA